MKTGTHKAQVGAGAETLKVGAGAETNSFGSATLVSRSWLNKSESVHCNRSDADPFPRGRCGFYLEKLEKYDSGKCRKSENGGQDERCGSESSCGGAESRKLRHSYNANYNKNRH